MKPKKIKSRNMVAVDAHFRKAGAMKDKSKELPRKSKYKTIKEQIERAEELINKMKEIGNNNTSMDYRAKWLMDKDFRTKQFEENPECFLVIRKKDGIDIPLIPICNRMALDNPMVTMLSLAMAQSLIGNEGVDQDHLGDVIKKLSSMIK